MIAAIRIARVVGELLWWSAVGYALFWLVTHQSGPPRLVIEHHPAEIGR